MTSQRSSLDSTAKVLNKTRINKQTTTVEAPEPIPYDEVTDHNQFSTKENLVKEVGHRINRSDCQEFFSMRKDSLTLLSTTFESILLVEKKPILESLQEKVVLLKTMRRMNRHYLIRPKSLSHTRRSLSHTLVCAAQSRPILIQITRGLEVLLLT